MDMSMFVCVEFSASLRKLRILVLIKGAHVVDYFKMSMFRLVKGKIIFMQKPAASSKISIWNTSLEVFILGSDPTIPQRKPIKIPVFPNQNDSHSFIFLLHLFGLFPKIFETNSPPQQLSPSLQKKSEHSSLLFSLLRLPSFRSTMITVNVVTCCCLLVFLLPTFAQAQYSWTEVWTTFSHCT